MITTEILNELMEKQRLLKLQSKVDGIDWCTKSEVPIDPENPYIIKCNIREHGRCSNRKCMFYCLSAKINIA